jgi:hypothetical protein
MFIIVTRNMDTALYLKEVKRAQLSELTVGMKRNRKKYQTVNLYMLTGLRYMPFLHCSLGHCQRGLEEAGPVSVTVPN